MKGTRKEITWPYIENSHQNYLFGSQGKGSVQKYSASSASFAGILWKIKRVNLLRNQNQIMFTVDGPKERERMDHLNGTGINKKLDVLKFVIQYL